MACLFGAGVSCLPISRRKSAKLVAQPFRLTTGVGVRAPAFQDAHELTLETHRICASDPYTLAQVSSGHPDEGFPFSLLSTESPRQQALPTPEISTLLQGCLYSKLSQEAGDEAQSLKRLLKQKEPP